MADTIRDVVVRIALKQIDSKLKVPETAPATKAILEYEQALVGSSKRANEGLKPVSDRFQQITEATEKAKIEQQALRRTIQDESIKSSEAFASAAEGVLILSRGLALMGIDAEDDLGKVVNQIASIQSGIDLLKGSTQTIKGLTEGFRSYKAATAAAAASQAALGTGTKVASAGMAALSVATGPVGLGLIAATAAVGGLLYAFSALQDEGVPAIDATAEATKRLKREQQAAADAQSELNANIAIASKVTKAEDELRRRSGSNRNQVIGVLGNRESALKRAINIAAPDAGRADAAGRLDGLGLDSKIEKAKEILSDQARRVSNNGDGERAKRIAEAVVGLSQRDLELVREKEKLAKDAIRDQQSMVDLAKAEFAEKSKLLSQERDRLSTAEERIGRLGGEDKLKLKNIGLGQAAGKSLNEEQARFLDQTGIGTGLSSKFFREQGQKFGARGILSNLGEGSKEDTLQAQAAAAKKAVESQSRIVSALETTADQIGDLVGQKIVSALESEALLRRIEQKIEQQLNLRSLQSR